MTRTANSTLTAAAVARRMLLLSVVRRFVQLAVIALFAGTARLGWTLFGQPLLSGDLSSSLIAGKIPLSDPFAVLQKLFAGHTPEMTMIAGALLVLVFYIIVGGRAFCAWVCPMNIVTDAAYAVRKKTGLAASSIRISRNARYAIAAGALIASIATGAAAFEWVSPQAFLWRELVWGIGLGLVCALTGVLALDLLLLERGWCGHLCPLGAFWSIVGKIGLVKPLFKAERCNTCGDCLRVCPEAHVINFKNAARTGFIAPGECTNCGRCAAACPENAISFGLRLQARPGELGSTRKNTREN